MKKTRLLRILLAVAAVGWGVSAVGIVLPWPAAAYALGLLGAGEVAPDPMLDYWLRMAAGAFTGIGLIFLAAARNPERFRAFIGPAGALMAAEGIILLLHGLRLGLAPFPFYGDTAFCLLVGTGIFVLRPASVPQGPAD